MKSVFAKSVFFEIIFPGHSFQIQFEGISSAGVDRSLQNRIIADGISIRDPDRAEPTMDMTEKDKVAIISGCYLFVEADSESLVQLAGRSSIEKLAKNAPLFMAGDEADGLRIVLDGLVRIWINDADGHELTLTLLEPGDAFGEIALLDGQPRSANATVIEPTSLLLLRRPVFEEVLQSDTHLARHLILLLCDILRRNTEELRGFAFHDLGVRLAQKLHELAIAHAAIDKGSARFTRKFSQTELAQMLGATREAVNKRIAAMSHDGLLRIENGLIEIPDLTALVSKPAATLESIDTNGK